MANKKKLTEGDIFYVEISGKYIFGKLLLDMHKRIFKLEPKHKLKFYDGCYLIEVYKGIYDIPELTTDEIIYPASFVFHSTFYPSKKWTTYVDWTFYKNEPIDYKALDFPETLETGDNGLIDFRKFDVSIPTKTFRNDFWPDTLNQKYTGGAFTIFTQMADEVFHLQGRDDLLTDKTRTYFQATKDLRFQTKDRILFYKQINENINISYYELALKHGFDLGRFYK
jgi:hypothetical protein